MSSDPSQLAVKYDTSGLISPDSTAKLRQNLTAVSRSNICSPAKDSLAVTFWQQLPFTIFMIAVLLIVFVLPFYLVFGGGMAKFALGPLRRRFSGLTVHELPAPGDVSFVYHTYRGLLIWVTQDQHIVHAPPVDAEILLKRLLRFNLTWGLLSYGLLFVPFLAIGNYWAQIKSIRAQASSSK